MIEIHSRSGVHRFICELATTYAEQQHGLMFRKHLPDGHGMLFDYHHEQPVAMWMRDVPIPLDMIFIRADGSIFRVHSNAEPLSDRYIHSGGRVRYVLEVNGGTARRLGIAPGDKVSGVVT